MDNPNRDEKRANKNDVACGSDNDSNDDCASFSLTIGPNNAVDWLAFCFGAGLLMVAAAPLIIALKF